METVYPIAHALDGAEQLSGLLLQPCLRGKMLGHMETMSREVSRYLVRSLADLVGSILGYFHLCLDASPHAPARAGKHHHEADHGHNLSAAHRSTALTPATPPPT
ncbi:hypothetical protein AOX55_00001730 [Sinorhizobium fredii CCBAU 25509]|nr:hypothetical protein AOX55_00001730 [Sinorhizobium fredii CCBAU 25509]